MKYWFIIVLFVVVLFLYPRKEEATQQKELTWWNIQSIDTMKFSRDLARAKLHDTSFDSVINTQVKKIADTGATHVAIATPYDDEFVPFLTRWVDAARKYNLHVWFRGNWSGWENWFDYKDITRSEHLIKTKQFILSHANLFKDGDIFTSCTECENGGPGDPRFTHDLKGFRQFLIDLHTVGSEAFKSINKQVTTNYFSANGDVAKLIWDEQTTKALGGVVVVDHYDKTPQQLATYIQNLATSSKGKIVLGELGAPLPDINGSMTDSKQNEWISEALKLLSNSPDVIGINYWTSFGGSTALWLTDGTAKPVVDTITNYYLPKRVTLKVKNSIGVPIKTSSVSVNGRLFSANLSGEIQVSSVPTLIQITVTAPEYESHGLLIDVSADSLDVMLSKTHENWLFKLQKLTYRLISGILH